ncbi:unnamed protein product [Rotaria sp. Silwood2]|nr:unnamed protein product [Rotaria sp. Silwood2]CAF4640474.1 unnamed protein product [Rotaria sp. Silwood2]
MDPLGIFDWSNNNNVVYLSSSAQKPTLVPFIPLSNDGSYTLEFKLLFFEYISSPSLTYKFENKKFK